MFSVRQTEKQIDCRHIVELKKPSKWISDETERPDGKSDRVCIYIYIFSSVQKEKEMFHFKAYLKCHNNRIQQMCIFTVPLKPADIPLCANSAYTSAMHMIY